MPITPGTDAAFFLGMASVILDEQLYDEDFVLNHTSLPFLVDVATGKLVRDHAEDPDAEEPETGEQNPFFVWDNGDEREGGLRRRGREARSRGHLRRGRRMPAPRCSRSSSRSRSSTLPSGLKA